MGWEGVASVGTLRVRVDQSMVVRGAGGGAMVQLAGEFLKLVSELFEEIKQLDC